jgi:thiol:disulfide interchange protein/DsbC/DsbD-like thiol-disulfide interchange protein
VNQKRGFGGVWVGLHQMLQLLNQRFQQGLGVGGVADHITNLVFQMHRFGKGAQLQADHGAGEPGLGVGDEGVVVCGHGGRLSTLTAAGAGVVRFAAECTTQSFGLLGFLMKWCVSLLAWGLVLLPAQAAVLKTDHVTAQLVAEQTAVQPGQTLRVGLKIDHQPHWHTYWRNPGDSGLPTTVNWTLPVGAQISDIQWPAPKRLPVGPLVNYGYEDELLLPQNLTVPTTAVPGTTLVLRAQANWLVCKDVCIPESGELSLQLPVVGRDVMPGSTAHLPTFDRLDRAAPRPLQGWTTRLQRAGGDLLLTLDAPSAAAPAATKPVGATTVASAAWPVVHVFPYVEQMWVPARHEVYRTATGYAFKLALMDGASVPASVQGVLVAQTSGDDLPPFAWASSPQKAGEFSAPMETVTALRWPQGAEKLADTGPQGEPVSLRGGGLASTGLLSWLLTLVLAFIGGMLLNLMPCVFPVLSIKLLSVTQQEGNTAGGHRRHALAYSLGVVLTFLALAGVLLALRSAGQAVGWGFQLQEPWVVLGLAMLFFLIGLNLLGAFEGGSWLPSGLASWRARQPGVDAFASGVLAVVAASPCTAPFMGAALGFAVTQSAATALLVFVVLGAGMAAPYVALVLSPGWRERLPRPGPWMLHLKQLLGFPMFLTVLWLLWVLGQQVGVDGLLAATLCLLALGFGLWLLGAWKGHPAWARGLALSVVVFALWLAAPLNDSQRPSATAQRTASDGEARAKSGGVDAAWVTYDPAQIDLHVAKGQAVFVDFTAAWCVSCQVNKKLVLNSESTQQAFAKAGVVLMRADWTNRDPIITDALARLGRSGVPVYVLYRPGKAPLLLPEVLTSGLVREALGTL